MSMSLLLALLPLAPAGDVHVVPTPGLYPTIQSAVDAAVDGDLVIVQAGVHAGFEIVGKGVVVVAAPDAIVNVTSAIVVRDTAADQHVVLQGLRASPPTFAASDALRVAQCAGDVRITSCELKGSTAALGSLASWSGARVTESPSVVIASSKLTGGQGDTLEDEQFQHATSPGGAGLHVVGSNVAVYSSVLTGGRGGEVLDTTSADAGDGGDGVFASASIVFLSSSHATGGHGGLADCEIFPFPACGTNGSGGHGLELANGSTAEWRASGFVGGGAYGGTGSGAFPGTPGSPIDVGVGSVTFNGGPDVFHIATSPVYPGENAHLRFRGPAGQLAIAAIGFEPLAPLPLLAGAGPVCVSPSGAFLLPLGTMPASGLASFPLTPPPAGGLPIAATLYTQGVLLDPFTASVHLADASQLALVDGLP